MLPRETQHVPGLEVPVHPPAAVQLRQPLGDQAQRLHSRKHERHTARLLSCWAKYYPAVLQHNALSVPRSLYSCNDECKAS